MLALKHNPLMLFKRSAQVSFLVAISFSNRLLPLTERKKAVPPQAPMCVEELLFKQVESLANA